MRLKRKLAARKRAEAAAAGRPGHEPHEPSKDKHDHGHGTKKPRPVDKPELLDEVMLDPTALTREKTNGDLSLDEKMSLYLQINLIMKFAEIRRFRDYDDNQRGEADTSFGLDRELRSSTQRQAQTAGKTKIEIDLDNQVTESS